MYSPHQAKFFAHWLTLQTRDEAALSRSLAVARVDMNPHQVDAAMFALRSPVSSGVLLADEVGLGKTIEAGLVMAQYWAQQRRRILLITPATLRKQWRQELIEKFGLDSDILEAKTYSDAIRRGADVPFSIDGRIVIASYEFAASKNSDVRAVEWDLVVLDEAHKLRNIYKGESAKRATALNEALFGRRKVLLTATPFQNSLMELYGLVYFISNEFFGSKEAFQYQYASGRTTPQQLEELKARLKPLYHRTLRRQVQKEGGINFTRRFSITQDFTPSDDEWELYKNVSAYLQDEGILAIKPGARHLVTLVIRKILASSSFAIADTLDRIIGRLQAMELIDEPLLGDYETANEIADSLTGEPEIEPSTPVLANVLHDEIERLSGYRDLARRIQSNQKGEALLQVLGRAFEMTRRLGGSSKAVIFTESRRTQAYLRDLLNANGYEGRVVLLNGTNDDADSKAIYAQWCERHAGSSLISGAKSADMKAAVVEEFRDRRDILIATEAGGEGINLQFCSLLVNFDLPWNPQRVEQRIGRVHRYGQKSDVVVVNFVNRKNRADELVFELLEKKFKLFDGVFGASDEILGAIESGVDIERRINAIYQHCRDVGEIERQFADLRRELDEQITTREMRAKQVLLENFDDEVVRNLRSRRESINERLSSYERQLLRLVQAERPDVQLTHDGVLVLPEGRYALTASVAARANALTLRLDEGVGAQLSQAASARDTPTGALRLNYAALGAQYADVRQYIGKKGYLLAAAMTVDTASDKVEEVLVVATTDDGLELPAMTAQRLLQIPGTFEPMDVAVDAGSTQLLTEEQGRVLSLARERNERWFREESDRLDRWADDQRLMLRQRVDELDAQVRDLRRRARQLGTLEEKAQAKREIKRLEQLRDDATLDFYARRREISEREDQMLEKIEKALSFGYACELLFGVAWSLVEE